MDNDAFVDAHNSIVKVTYVETDINGFPADYAPTASPRVEELASEDNTRGIEVESGGGDDDQELLLPLLLVAGAVLIVAAGIVTYRNT